MSEPDEAPEPTAPDEPIDSDETVDAWANDGDEWLGAEWLPEDWEHDETIEPTREVDRFRRTTAGSMLVAGMLGLQQVLEPRKKEDPPIVVEAPGEPPGEKRLEFELDPDDPSASTITVRPWVE